MINRIDSKCYFGQNKLMNQLIKEIKNDTHLNVDWRRREAELRWLASPRMLRTLANVP